MKNLFDSQFLIKYDREISIFLQTVTFLSSRYGILAFMHGLSPEITEVADKTKLDMISESRSVTSLGSALHLALLQTNRQNGWTCECRKPSAGAVYGSSSNITMLYQSLPPLQFILRISQSTHVNSNKETWRKTEKVEKDKINK